MMKLISAPSRLPWPIHLALGIASLLGMFLTLDAFNAAYAASQIPVDFMTEQTRFSGQQTKEYYALMIDLGTLEHFKRAQIVDFGYIFATFLTGLFLVTFVARLGREGSWTKRLGGVAAYLMIAGACFDAVENLISFAMLANPTDFANWIAIPYSTAASLKLTIGTLGVLGALIAIALLVFGRILNKPKLG